MTTQGEYPERLGKAVLLVGLAVREPLAVAFVAVLTLDVALVKLAALVPGNAEGGRGVELCAMAKMGHENRSSRGKGRTMIFCRRLQLLARLRVYSRYQPRE